ncbi:hypothetical protein FB446DRAFT_658022, partial [Lentinula raphanica]
MLHPRGIIASDIQCQSFKIYLCGPCRSFLSRDALPRLSLNNHLFRGDLPSQFCDMTWAEEMACALYRTTAHVSRLYGSGSDEDPFQLHGNVCAHPLDICYTATHLPWAPADINDLISIVFVGCRKLSKDEMRKSKSFFVRRHIIRCFLNFACLHNKLYIGLPPPDENILNLYPENDILPGLEERIVY